MDAPALGAGRDRQPFEEGALARAASTSTLLLGVARVLQDWPGYQLLRTSWSSHWWTKGTRAANERRFSSSRLYANWPRNSSSVSATLLFAGVVSSATPVRPGASRLRERVVGVDHVAAAEEEVRRDGLHGSEERRPPMSGLMPQPWPTTSAPHTNETLRRRPWGAVTNDPRTGAEVTTGRRGPRAARDRRPRARAQAAKPDLAGQIGGRGQDGALDHHGAPERGRGARLDQHAAGPVGARPNDAGALRHIAALDAVGDLGARGHEGEGLPGRQVAPVAASPPATRVPRRSRRRSSRGPASIVMTHVRGGEGPGASGDLAQEPRGAALRAAAVSARSGSSSDARSSRPGREDEIA